MRLGAVFPHPEIEPTDVGAVRVFAARVEDLRLDHILIADHVVGADSAVRPDWPGPYDLRHGFHEAMVVAGFLAALTSAELVTGVLVLPQRQTVLVAKQAAELDVLTHGRFRLGVGVGWNPVEFEALGQRFDARGRRIERQIELLRTLWTEASVSTAIDAERVGAAGLNPLPVQRPIPIWIGGGATPGVLERVGRVADGWMPDQRYHFPGRGLEAAWDHIREVARAAGRDTRAIGLQGVVSVADGDLARACRAILRWEAAGATHVAISTKGARVPLDRALDLLARCAGSVLDQTNG